MKTRLGPINVMYPTPVVLIGAHVGGRPNFITIAHVGIVTVGTPNCISLGMGKIHYTNQGIHENQTFSVNIPTENLVVETDYCGLVTGKNTDKSQVFDVFYGQLDTAPLIAQCPLNMECRLYDVVDFPDHDLFIGEIVETHADPAVLTDGVVDLTKLKPLLFDMATKAYFGVGGHVARAWNVGKQLKKKS
ncbi:MAG: flavin reductase family protein [Proteobacteria bacterium]|nr:flavin reductase family protein [Pseudomonadota bacterium]MBU1740723.1 flavin reductase family protein [Pseudomonadota bacterium]